MAHTSARPGWSRVTVACVAALVACLVAGTSALADSTSGVRGHSVVTDSTSHPAVTCNYTPDYPNHYLVSLSVRAPSLWWPNLSSSDHSEHGTLKHVAKHYRMVYPGYSARGSGTCPGRITIL